jgi:inosine-uridine nucleoside N-ribohydrolase
MLLLLQQPKIALGGATITHVGDVTTNQTCTNRFTLTRTYRASDACGNSAHAAR